MRVDKEVPDFLREMGMGYQTEINATLKCHVSRMRHE
jgi:uncharacterized protein (DUF4415 family)